MAKLHGDYLDTRILNTPSELSKYDAMIDEWLDRVIDEYGLIVSGWSGEWDTALRAAIERCKSRRFGFYWASVGEPHQTANSLVTRRGGSFVRVQDADQFFEGLAEKLTALDDVCVEHPLNVATLVSLTKRYVSTQGQHIKLHDLLMRETDRTFGEVNRYHDEQRQTSTSDYGRGVRVYLAATASLRAMAATAAYWGGDGVVPLLTKCLMRLSHDPAATRGSGVVLNDAFRIYPAMIVLYSAGLGLIAGDHFAAAGHLLTTTQTHSFHGLRSIVIEFTHAIGDINVFTKGVPEYKDKRVPFSELMFATLRPELSELFSDALEYERRFDDFELIMGMLYGDTYHPKFPEKPEELNLTPGRYVWKHFGHGLRSSLFWRQEQGDELAWTKGLAAFQQLVGAGHFQRDWARVVALGRAAAGTAARWRFLS